MIHEEQVFLPCILPFFSVHPSVFLRCQLRNQINRGKKKKINKKKSLLQWTDGHSQGKLSSESDQWERRKSKTGGINTKNSNRMVAKRNT